MSEFRHLENNLTQCVALLLYKILLGLIIHQYGELICCSSKAHEYHELLPLLKEQTKRPVFLENLHIDYKLKKGINYKVILHE